MERQAVTVIFDIGKTNKKFMLLNEKLALVKQEYKKFDELTDDDNYPCDNIDGIAEWIREKMNAVLRDETLEVKALNFSTYGSSLVHVDKEGQRIAPFYNYLKPFPPELEKDLWQCCGSQQAYERATSSPYLGFMNAGLHLMYLKQEKPQVWSEIEWSVHFPQYLSALFTKKLVSEYTSIGCHTGMWNFAKGGYAEWLKAKQLDIKLPPIVNSTHIEEVRINGQKLKVGPGAHDSSAALIPYLHYSSDPFLLISTGTWSITMNPFAEGQLTDKELEADCLHFLQTDGSTVKAARLFLGEHYKEQVHKIAEYFDIHHRDLYEVKWKSGYESDTRDLFFNHDLLQAKRFGFTYRKDPDLSRYASAEEAYYTLLNELTNIQIASMRLAHQGKGIERLYIDGGFVDNEVFVQMMANKLPFYDVYTSRSALGSSLGAAMLVREEPLSAEQLREMLNIKKVDRRLSTT